MYISYQNRGSVDALLGVTLAEVRGMENGSEEILFVAEDGRQFGMYHEQNCCENVYLEDVEGDVEDLIGSPLTVAEEVDGVAEAPEYAESHTWTFYRLATAKGWVVLRWLGTSNGYYSESVDFGEIK